MTLDPLLPDDQAQAEHTRRTILLYHQAWKQRDLEAVMRLYHPDVEYHDFSSHQVVRLPELRDFVQSSLPHLSGELLEHTDRIRIDGHTAFIQYRICLRGGNDLLSFRASEAITVLDGLVWRVNEYANLERAGEVASTVGRPALSRLGLSTRQIGILAGDLEDYFQRQRPYLDPELNLQQVADATGYTRNQVSHLLNQVLGQSFYRYVNQARLKHLLNALEQDCDSARVDGLAFAAGFNSISAFYKCFREHLGMTPKAYLKQFSTRARRQDTPRSS
ncbi:MAG: helix-turn-helix domain-containing protein [Pseudomonas sp.]|uniref:AraC family transcriptional regulator n=1 Tax=unclassified Pseudomonas TaxID=196821 RepID=UPI00072FF27C|nr:nuclear transport factor 2 family protein [Pseudomonas sp. L5B5]KTC35857.1 AraC family transcriptional regulator [Pseudomonas sp. ABAC61]UCZ85827.1 nuclear transport factor 2 family protein [Pseudomonas sp. L5B5]